MRGGSDGKHQGLKSGLISRTLRGPERAALPRRNALYAVLNDHFSTTRLHAALKVYSARARRAQRVSPQLLKSCSSPPFWSSCCSYALFSDCYGTISSDGTREGPSLPDGSKPSIGRRPLRNAQ